MSSVYLADDIILDREVVVKLIKTDPHNLEKSKSRFLREVESTTQLSHPNIVSVYDVDDTEEYQILVTEVVFGPTLKEYIRDNQPLKIDEVIQLSKMILDGMSHAHESGIIHRDIKPQNILLNYKNEVKITDFGIAKALSETRMTETNQVMGSVQYISPEQAKGQNTDERTDIYSFGIVLFEMLTGELPFHGETPVSVAIKQISEPMPDISTLRDVPIGLKKIIQKCTEKKQEDRYRHVEDVYNDMINYDILSERTEDDIEDTLVTERITSEDDSSQISYDEELNYEDTNERPRRRRMGCLLGFIFIFFILLPILYISYIMVMDMTDNSVELPNLVNLTVEEAESVLAPLELSIGDVESVYDEEVEEDLIISTSPGAFTELEPGDEVDVVVSLGREPTEMPNFVGEDIDDVMDDIEEMGFDDVEIEEEYTEEDNEGEILEQSIEEGREIFPEEETLTLTVSLGIEMVEVENYIGYASSYAVEQLEELEFEVEVVNNIYHNSIPQGSVVYQNPYEGELEIGSLIELTLSLGPEPPQQRNYSNTVVVPYLTSLNQDDDDDEDDNEDEESEENDGSDENELQIVRVYISDANNSIDNVYEVFGITQDAGYTVNMVIRQGTSARYVITVNDETVIDATVPY